ncbi:hypothetical protein TWF281_000355 [Arthrobotrys megalospora]
MVSFSCEACNETLAKKKLDQHRGRCRQAVFTCLDCNNTFHGTSYREHTSCISEAQKYERTVYRGEKKKGKGTKGGQQNGVNGAEKVEVAVAAPEVEAPAPAVEEEKVEEVQEEAAEEEVKEKRKDKKDKKDKKEKKDKKKKSKDVEPEEATPQEEDVAMNDTPEVAEEHAVEEKKEKKSKKEKKEKKDKKDKKSKKKVEEEPEEEEEKAEEQPEEEAAFSLDNIIMEDTTPYPNGTAPYISKKRKRDATEPEEAPAAKVVSKEAPKEVDEESPKEDTEESSEEAPAPTSKADGVQEQSDFISFADIEEPKKSKLQERKRPRTEKEILRDERRKAAKLNYDQTYKKLKTELETKYADPKTLEPLKASFKDAKGPALMGVKCVVKEIMNDPVVQGLTPKEAKHIKNRLRKDERKKRLLAATKKRREAKKVEKQSPKILKGKMDKLEAKIEKDKRKREKLERQIEKSKRKPAATAAAAAEE